MIAGHEQPFSVERQRQLYPTQADYQKRFADSVAELTKARFIVPEDGPELIASVE
jgi:hypothetical protein